VGFFRESTLPKPDSRAKSVFPSFKNWRMYYRSQVCIMPQLDSMFAANRFCAKAWIDSHRIYEHQFLLHIESVHINSCCAYNLSLTWILCPTWICAQHEAEHNMTYVRNMHSVSNMNSVRNMNLSATCICAQHEFCAQHESVHNINLFPVLIYSF